MDTLEWWSCGNTVRNLEGMGWYTCGRVMAHIWMGRVAHENESCGRHANGWLHTYERVMARIWMSHGTRMNESWHTYEEWVMAHVWMSHGTNMNESLLAPCAVGVRAYHLFTCLSQLILNAHISMNGAAHINESIRAADESRHMCEWVMAHQWLSRVASETESWHIRE